MGSNNKIGYNPAPVAAMTDEERERQRYEKKSQLLQRALKEADEMDKKKGC